ncbi:hypothetical protein GCM10025869_18270 [Homoserinibacter gongjuensis]|uniref:Uncharacterized protein n=1 Tax=Homoserinibacter gongjuensis TaxID=1162968 RepID=A0ABQ6JT21_9MICO|nr:hypothetical protein GCM10025869_18270 [Homoserinibacter gongjuensis]
MRDSETPSSAAISGSRPVGRNSLETDAKIAPVSTRRRKKGNPVPSFVVLTSHEPSCRIRVSNAVAVGVGRQ